MAGGTIEQQSKLIKKTDWDWLVILDAMRWDIWHQYTGEGKPCWSCASSTAQWCRGWGKWLESQNIRIVSGNPRTTELQMSNVDKVYETAWTEINGLPCVPPEAVAEAALRHQTCNERVIVWFLQPHAPYPLHEPPIPAFKFNKEGKVRTVTSVFNPENVQKRLRTFPRGFFTPELITNAYLTNVEWVLDALTALFNTGKTIYLTADHGECLGEDKKYGHWPRTDEPLLRTVPWAKLNVA